MALFDGIESAVPGVGGVYLSDGIYPDLEVLAVKAVKNRKGINGFCVELLVRESSGPKAMMPGTKCAWITNQDKDAFLGSVKGFLLVAMSELNGSPLELKDIDKDTAEMAVSAANPLAGTHLSAQATTIKTRAGDDFTKVEWSPKSFKMAA